MTAIEGGKKPDTTEREGDGSKQTNRKPVRNVVLGELEKEGGIRGILKEPFHIMESDKVDPYKGRANFKKDGVVTEFFPKVPYNDRRYAVYRRLVLFTEGSKQRGCSLFACNPVLIREILDRKADSRCNYMNGELTREREFKYNRNRSSSVMDQEERYSGVNSSSICFDLSLDTPPYHQLNILLGKREYIDGSKKLVIKARRFNHSTKKYEEINEFSEGEIPESIGTVEDFEAIEEKIKEQVLQKDTSQK